MKKGYLSSYFTGAGTKILSSVDASKKKNQNQHEIGDSEKGKVLARVLGTDPRMRNNRFGAKYIWLFDEQESITELGFLSWYDSRKNQPKRDPEWRLYYQSNAVTNLMEKGDRLFVAKQKNDNVFFIVVPEHSIISRQLMWLFGLDFQNNIDFNAKVVDKADDTKLDYVARFVLDEIGIELEDPESNRIERIIEKFKTVFPTTREFSQLARQTLPQVDAFDDADIAIIAWLEQEDLMFRALERKIIEHRLKIGFDIRGVLETEEFLRFSKSLHQRRSSRMGQSLEHHLSAVFEAKNLVFTRTAKTENNAKPDFLFPSQSEYDLAKMDVNNLILLGAKSTCKDRWRQVLTEGTKVTNKHLFTLEPGISENQTEEMKANHLQLIVPAPILKSYNDNQQTWLLSLEDFVGFVIDRNHITAT